MKNKHEERLEVKFNFRTMGTTYNTNIHQFFWAALGKDNTVVQTSIPHTCRESLASIARDNYNGVTAHRYMPTEKTIFSKISIAAVVCGSTAEKALNGGLKVLNMIEEHYGWKPTVMYMLEKYPAPQMTRGYDYALYVGSSKWMRSTHMISLYTLLIRLGKLEKVQRCKTFESLSDYIKKPNSRNIDLIWAKKSFEKMDILLGDYKSMFKGLTRKYLYSIEQLKSSQDQRGFGEGISVLVTGRSGDKKLLVRLAEMCMKHKQKNQACKTQGNK